MITLIEARRFRSLKYIRQHLEPFHVLVGPNASGKSTFLDVIAFLGRLVSEGIDAAVSERTENFVDLVWQREETEFELAIEALIPAELLDRLPKEGHDSVRYEVQLGILPEGDEHAIVTERVFFISTKLEEPREASLFPNPLEDHGSIVHNNRHGWKRIIGKSHGKRDSYTPEVKLKSSKGWVSSFKFGHKKSALGMLPEDETLFPVSMWLKKLLIEGVQMFVLNSAKIRKPSPPNQKRGFNTDGSNLPWVIGNLKKHHEAVFLDWISHLRTALPDITDVKTLIRNEDRHAYLCVKYGSELWVPSWMVSDGTLRMMALTLPAYLPDFQGIYLIEEPENGIHPKAIETIFQSMTSVYGAQILLATHSPIILSQAEPTAVLCFAKDESGATDIISGNEHPRLREWQGETTLGSLLAAGVLG